MAAASPSGFIALYERGTPISRFVPGADALLPVPDRRLDDPGDA
jgi:hypothetical protein